jgi:sugar phosphate isomerase/epimerase
MPTPAFSTVATPDWTLAQVTQRAAALGFQAVELRTFGDDSRQFACDPALTSDDKVRSLCRQAGIDVVCVSSSVRFDEPVFPPVIGYLSPNVDKSIREGKRAVDLAVSVEAPFVRVFGFEIPAYEKRSAAVKRITERLIAVVDHADKTGVRVVVENGGSFSSAAQLRELIDAVNSPLCGAAYSPATAAKVGDDSIAAIRTLGDKLWLVHLKDAKNGTPCPLGEGELRCKEFVAALVAARFTGPIVFEHDRAWLPGLAPAEDALAQASRTLYNWLGAPTRGTQPAVPAPAPATKPAKAGARR